MQQEEDVNITVNQLGVLLHVYRRKTGFIRFYRWASVCLTVMMALAVWNVLRHWSWPVVLQPETYETFLLDNVTILMPFLASLLFIVLAQREARRLQQDRIMIYEHGLLLMRNGRKRQADVLRWEDIEEIIDKSVLIREYALRRREGKEVVLDMTYQHLDALVAEIRRHVRLAADERVDS